MTLARHLRDIIITEYGIVDCRSKTDSEVIKTILNITDSRYLEKLLETAKNFGKVSSDYEIPKIFQNNYPDTLNDIIQEFRSRGFFKPYPFGCELTAEEQVIMNALMFLKNCTKLQLIVTMGKAFLFFQSDAQYNKYL